VGASQQEKSPLLEVNHTRRRYPSPLPVAFAKDSLTGSC